MSNQFDELGYLRIDNLWDSKELFSEVPKESGSRDYKNNLFESQENQVEGSASRYWYPQYRKIHTDVRLKLEKILKRKLYNTYYFDRFYFPGQELLLHTDRDACEISVTVHVSTNLTGADADWPICLIGQDEKPVCVSLQPGDGLLYKGCELPHWRNPMPEPENKEVEYYYHQIFFHLCFS